MINSPSLYASYIVAFLTLGAIFIGAGYSFQAGGQVYIEILVDKLRPLPRKICFTIGYCLGLVFVVELIIECWKATGVAYEFKWEATGNLTFPVFILYGVMAFGCALLALTIGMNLVRMWKDKDAFKEEGEKEENES
jgi:TRAP-type C4-dicarboxylate transport system permease small subunit